MTSITSQRGLMSFEREFLKLLRKIEKTQPADEKVSLNKKFVQQLLAKGELVRDHLYLAAIALARLEVLSVELSLADSDRLFFKDYHRQFCRLVGEVSGNFSLILSTSPAKAFRVLKEYDSLRRFSAISNLLTPQDRDEPIRFVLLYRNSGLVAFAIIRSVVHYNLVLMIGISACKTGKQFWQVEAEMVNYLRTLPGRLFFADQSVFVRRI